jgi:hypothetical protein
VTHKYILPLLDALLTLDLALAFHPHKDKDGVVRKTGRRLLLKQHGMGKDYLRSLVASKTPYASLCALNKKLGELR